MIIGIIYSLKEGLMNGVEALSITLQSSGLSTKCIALEDLEFATFDCQIDAISSIDAVYFLTNDTTVETLTLMFVKGNKSVVNANHFLRRFSKLTVQYLLFENGLLIPKNYFSPASVPMRKLADSLIFPVIVKSYKHMDPHVVLANNKECRALQESNEIPLPCYFEKYLSDNHVIFKSYVVKTDVYYDVTGQMYNSPTLKCQLEKIGRIFSLEAYSVDCIVSCATGHTYFIDVNPAPAFMGSSEARLRLADYLKSL